MFQSHFATYTCLVKTKNLNVKDTVITTEVVGSGHQILVWVKSRYDTRDAWDDFFVAKAEGLLRKIGAHRRSWARTLRSFCWKFHEIFFCRYLSKFVGGVLILPVFFCWESFSKIIVADFLFLQHFRKKNMKWVRLVFSFVICFFCYSSSKTSTKPERHFPSFSDQLGVPCHFLGRNWLIAFTPSMVVEHEITYKTSDDACGEAGTTQGIPSLKLRYHLNTWHRAPPKKVVFPPSICRGFCCKFQGG